MFAAVYYGSRTTRDLSARWGFRREMTRSESQTNITYPLSFTHRRHKISEFDKARICARRDEKRVGIFILIFFFLLSYAREIAVKFLRVIVIYPTEPLTPPLSHFIFFYRVVLVLFSILIGCLHFSIPQQFRLLSFLICSVYRRVTGSPYSYRLFPKGLYGYTLQL